MSLPGPKSLKRVHSRSSLSARIGERPGVMFADLELIGIPHRLTVGDRGLKDGKVEMVDARKLRKDPSLDSRIFPGDQIEVAQSLW